MADSGWYPDPSDESLERFWDGAAWTTSTRARTVAPPPVADEVAPFAPIGGAGPADAAPPGYQAPAGWAQPPAEGTYPQPPAGGYQPPAAGGYQQPAYQPPAYQPPAYQAAAYVPYGAPVTAQVGAPWGRRALAALIDLAIGAVPLVVAYIVFFVLLAAESGTDSGVLGGLGALLLLAAVLWTIGFGIWNQIIRQGKTGQTIGKSKIGLRLIKDIDGQPIGAGMAIVRYIVPSVISNFTCGIFGLLDILWPLWDAQRKRLIDKWFNFSVIEV